MPRRSEHSREELRQLALDAVHEIVEEQGIAALSTRKVADRIGYTVGMLYHVFDNLDDLILHANARVVRDLVARCDKAVRGKPPEKAILAVALEYLSLSQKHGAHWQLVFDHSMRDGAAVPVWYQAITDDLFKLVEKELLRLAPGKPQREIALTARVLWSSVHGICLLSVTQKLDIGGAINSRRAVTSLITHYLCSWQQG